jgi:hypothetical protein
LGLELGFVELPPRGHQPQELGPALSVLDEVDHPRASDTLLHLVRVRAGVRARSRVRVRVRLRVRARARARARARDRVRVRTRFSTICPRFISAASRSLWRSSRSSTCRIG